MDMNPKSPALRIGSGSAPLVNSDAGHYAIDLKPESWRAIYDAHASFAAGTTLPRRLRTRTRAGPASSATLTTSRCTTTTPEPARVTTRGLLPALLKSVLVCAAVCASSVLGSDRGGTSRDMYATSLPCTSRYDNYHAQSRGQSAQRVMAPHHGHNYLETDKRQVRFADSLGRSECLTAEHSLDDYSRCATCLVQCYEESHMPCVQCGAATCVGCLVSDACPACYVSRLAGDAGDSRTRATAPRVARHPEGHATTPGFWHRACRIAPRSRRTSSLRRESATRRGRSITSGTCDHGSLSADSEEHTPHRVLLPSGFVDVSGLDGVRRSSPPRLSAGLRRVPATNGRPDRRLCKGGHEPRLERATARRLAMHSLERADAHPCCDLTNISLAPRAPEEPVKKDAQAPRGLARQAARPHVRGEL